MASSCNLFDSLLINRARVSPSNSPVEKQTSASHSRQRKNAIIRSVATFQHKTSPYPGRQLANNIFPPSTTEYRRFYRPLGQYSPRFVCNPRWKSSLTVGRCAQFSVPKLGTRGRSTSVIAEFMGRNDVVKSLTAGVFSTPGSGRGRERGKAFNRRSG